jgi:hypothetical protein
MQTSSNNDSGNNEMTGQFRTVINKSNGCVLRMVLLGSLAVAIPLFAAEGPASPAMDSPEHVHGGYDHTAPAKLVELVRTATLPFIDVNVATAANYQPFLGCVSGPDHGAMGIHYVNGTLVGDGEIDSSKPEALIYEPSESGLRLVGVEFIVDSATWLAHHDSPPVLEGQTFQLVGSPNRYGLAAFFELHVWAWRDNPNGAFVDWNNRVTCEGQ